MPGQSAGSTYSYTEVGRDEDAEELRHSDEENLRVTDRASNMSLNLWKMGSVLMLVGCAAGTLTMLNRHPVPVHVRTARMLLESSDVADMATQFHMSRRSQQNLPAGFAQREEARASIEAELRRHAPPEARRLDSVVLTEREQEGLKHVLHHLADSRFLKLTDDAGRYLLRNSDGRPVDSSQQRRLKAFFQTRSAEVRRLRMEIFGDLPGRLSRADKVAPEEAQGQVSRRLQIYPTTPPGLQPGLLTTTAPPVDMLSCEEIDNNINNARAAAMMMKMAMADQIKDMAKSDPIVQDTSNAISPSFDFLGCVDNMRKTPQGKCQDFPTEADKMIPDAADMTKFQACVTKFLPFAMNVLSDLGMDDSDDTKN